jgi:hypothetical protein
MRYDRLSEDLICYIEESDSKRDLSPDERAEAEKNERLVRFVTEHMVAARETFLTKPMREIERLLDSDRDLIASLMDDYNTRQQLDRVHDYVKRTLELTQLEHFRDDIRIPSETTRTYLREATRTFIYGLDQACIALCRAAVEQGLKDRLDRQGLGLPLTRGQIVQEAYDYSYLDENTKALADAVFEAGDAVLHEVPATSQKALDTLKNAQAVLTAAFSHTGKLRPSVLRKSSKANDE